MPFKGNYYYYALIKKIPRVRQTSFRYCPTSSAAGGIYLSGESPAIWDGGVAAWTLRFLYRQSEPRRNF